MKMNSRNYEEMKIGAESMGLESGKWKQNDVT